MKKHTLRLGVLTFTAFLSAAAFADLVQDFEAAVKAGKPLSAEAAYVKLVKAGKTVSPSIHLQAAEVARALGKGTARDDRTLLYLRLEKGWNASVEQALWRLCSSGSDVDLFARLNGNSKADRALWSVGRDMLGRLAAANRPQELLKLADLLMAKFPQKDRLNSVLGVLYENARNCGPNYPKTDLAQMLMRHAGLGACDNFWNLLSYGNQRDAFAPEFGANYVARNGGEISDDILGRVLDALDYNNVDEEKDAAKAAARDARVTAAKKAEKTIFDGKHPQSARKYVWVAGGKLPKAFFPGWKKDEPVTGLKALYDRLVTSERYKESESYRRDVQNVRNNLISWKRFSAQDCAALVDADPASFSADWLGGYSSLGSVSKAVQDTKSTAPIAKLAQKFPKQADAIYRNNFYRYVYMKKGQGDVAGAKRIFIDIVRNDANFSWAVLDWMIGGCQAMRVADKVDLFKSGYVLTGFNGAWKEFRKRAAANAKDGFFADPAVKAFGATIKDDALSGDPLLKARQMLGRAKTHAERHAAAADFLKAFPTKLGAAKTERDNALAKDFFGAYWQGIRSGNTKEDAAKWLNAFLPKFAKGILDNSWVEEFLRKAEDAALWRQYYDARIAAGDSYDLLGNMVVPKKAEKMDKPYTGIDMKKMSASAAYNHFSWNWDNLKDGPDKIALYWNFVSSRPFGEHTVDGARKILDIAYGISFPEKAKEYDKAFLAKFPLDEAEKAMFARKEVVEGVWMDGPLRMPEETVVEQVEQVNLKKTVCDQAKSLPLYPKEIWELDFVLLPSYRTAGPNPRFLYLLVAVNAESGERMVWERLTVDGKEGGLLRLWSGHAQRVLDAVVRLGRVPGEIHMRSGRVMRFLRPLGLQLPFKLVQHAKLPSLESVLNLSIQTGKV